MQTFITDIVSGNSQIFSSTAGSFLLVFEGLDPTALYDIRTSAVPIPAAAPLFLSAIGRLGIAARRRKKQK